MPQVHVSAFWDAEASVWVATSDDVPGLVVEADTMPSLISELEDQADDTDALRLALDDIARASINSEAQYDAAVRALNALLDAGGADEEHELAPVVDALGEIIGAYDDKHYPLPPG